MKFKLNEERLTRREAQLKDYLLNIVLIGYPEYARVFKKFTVRIDDDPGMLAAVDPARGIVYLNYDRVRRENKDTLSMLVRHEMLHVMLNHIPRELSLMAIKLGLDPKHIKRRDMKRLWQEAWKEQAVQYTVRDVEGKGLNSGRIGNIVGDLDLARYYLATDKTICRTFGALIREDNPEWARLPFEDLYKAIQEDDKKLKKRLQRAIKGHMDANGNFVPNDPDDKGKNAFEGTDTIANEDVRGVNLAQEFDIVSSSAAECKDLYDSLAHTSFCILEYEEQDDVPDSDEDPEIRFDIITVGRNSISSRIYTTNLQSLTSDNKFTRQGSGVLIPQALKLNYTDCINTVIVQFKYANAYKLKAGDIRYFTFDGAKTPAMITYANGTIGRAALFCADGISYKVSSLEDLGFIELDKTARRSVADLKGRFK